jgi:hypothetical protein
LIIIKQSSTEKIIVGIRRLSVPVAIGIDEANVDFKKQLPSANSG